MIKKANDFFFSFEKEIEEEHLEIFMLYVAWVVKQLALIPIIFMNFLLGVVTWK